LEKTFHWDNDSLQQEFIMKRRATLLGITLAALGWILFLFAGCADKSGSQTATARGQYLVSAGGCGDCHSPKVFTASGFSPDTQRLLAGYPSGAKLPEVPRGIIGPSQWGAVTTNDMTAWLGPWGVSFASNLTPDRKTGIGNWSEGLFLQALRNGKFMGTSRDILPPMPWRSIARLTDEDLKAIFAYIMSLPPIENEVPPPLPPE
jgi:mono/diheme cytochrome c family protein